MPETHTLGVWINRGIHFNIHFFIFLVELTLQSKVELNFKTWYEFIEFSNHCDR